MTQIEKIRKKSGGYISYKFYGIKDLSAGFDVKFIIDNRDFLKDIFATIPTKTTIDSLDEFRLFFLAKKIGDMEEIIPYINTDKNKTIVKDLALTCRKYCEGIGQGAVVKYINKSYKYIFNKNKLDHALADVTLEFIYEHNNGIKKPVWIFLANEYGYRLLNEYAKIKKVIFRNDYGCAMLDMMIKIESPTNLIEYHLDDIFNVLSDILLNHKENNKLIQVVKQKTNQIYNIIDNLNEDDITERDLLIKDGIYRELLNYLRKIKDKRANEFSKKTEELSDKLNEWLKTNGKTVSYEIPVGEIVNMWRKDEHWESRLLSLTHSFHKSDNGNNVRVLSRLEECEKSDSILDFCSVNMPTDEYFTYSRQLALQMQSNVGGGTIFAILLNDDDAKEYYKLIVSAINHIQDIAKSNKKKTLLTDTDMLISNIETIRKNKNKTDVKAIYYGTAMLACALSEKVLKIIYEDLIMDMQYISTDSLELGSLLNSDNKENPLIPVFGANHLKHLAFFLSKVGDNRVGYGTRNSLAHLSDNIEDKLGDQLLSQLLWIFTDILNTVFWYYVNNIKSTP